MPALTTACNAVMHVWRSFSRCPCLPCVAEWVMTSEVKYVVLAFFILALHLWNSQPDISINMEAHLAYLLMLFLSGEVFNFPRVLMSDEF